MEVPTDHSFLLLTELHKAGIRSARWLDEVLDDPHSVVYEITLPRDRNPIFFTVGFCKEMVPILYVFEFTDRIISRQARKATIDEIIEFWCN